MHVCSGKLNMSALPPATDREQLFAVAESQGGYFTMAQALAAGFARSTHHYHVEKGNWIREHRGIYRLRLFPRSDHEQLVLWSLWSRDRKGVPQGVYSHSTVLALRELSDVNPSRLHMTVPPAFRRNSEVPSVLLLHKARLAEDEIVRERGYSVTTVMRAIVDVAVSGEVDDTMLHEAMEEGLRRGLITRRELDRVRHRADVPGRLVELMKGGGR
jgi:predicted transcriptional regulator of viral defense system